MWCGKCDREFPEDCCCEDRAERLRAFSGEGGPLASRWCVRCDSHYALCRCETPDWVVRMDGKFYPVPDAYMKELHQDEH